MYHASLAAFFLPLFAYRAYLYITEKMTETLTAPTMSFTLSEEQKFIQETARNFAQQELLPGVIERDTKESFPQELVHKMGEQGFMGMMVSPEYGGGGLDTMSYVLAMEELSKIDASASVMVSVNNSLVTWGIETFGNEEQKKKYLPKLASGEQIGCFCLSEPEAGSDATSQRTTAEDKGDYYLLNGTKNWITNGGRAEVASGHRPDGSRERPPRHQLPHRGKRHGGLPGGQKRREAGHPWQRHPHPDVQRCESAEREPHR